MVETGVARAYGLVETYADSVTLDGGWYQPSVLRRVYRARQARGPFNPCRAFGQRVFHCRALCRGGFFLLVGLDGLPISRAKCLDDGFGAGGETAESPGPT